MAELLHEMKGHGSRASDPLLSPIYLQEVSDWQSELRSWRRKDYPNGALVALCREWSDYVWTVSLNHFEDLAQREALVALQRWFDPLDCLPEGRQSLMIECPQEAPALDVAKDMMDAYITACIKTQPGTDAWNPEVLHERFLALSIAFDVVARHAPDDVRLALLATQSPSQIPALGGLDLWLQRRALHACVSHWGLRFVVEHLDRLRSDAMLSMVMGGGLSASALVEFQSLLESGALSSRHSGDDELSEAVRARLQHL